MAFVQDGFFYLFLGFSFKVAKQIQYQPESKIICTLCAGIWCRIPQAIPVLLIPCCTAQCKPSGCVTWQLDAAELPPRGTVPALKSPLTPRPELACVPLPQSLCMMLCSVSISGFNVEIQLESLGPWDGVTLTSSPLVRLLLDCLSEPLDPSSRSPFCFSQGEQSKPYLLLSFPTHMLIRCYQCHLLPQRVGWNNGFGKQGLLACPCQCRHCSSSGSYQLRCYL